MAEPGVLWTRKVALEQSDADGWRGYLVVYGFASRGVLEAYLTSATRERIIAEGKSLFGDAHRIERWYGSVDFEVVSPGVGEIGAGLG